MDIRLVLALLGIAMGFISLVIIVFRTFRYAEYHKDYISRSHSIMNIFTKPNIEIDDSHREDHGIQVKIIRQFMKFPHIIIEVPRSYDNVATTFVLRNYQSPDAKDKESHASVSIKGRSILRRAVMTKNTFEVNISDVGRVEQMVVRAHPEPLWMEAYHKGLGKNVLTQVYHPIMSHKTYYLSVI